MPGPTAVDAAVARLRARGERLTAPRRQLLDALAASPAHPTAEDLLRELAESGADVHRATVYRTLEFLVRIGVVAHVHLPHGATTYHLATDQHRAHAHLVCRGCEQVLDVHGVLDAAAEEARRQLGFVVDVDHVALTGWCRDCAPALD